MTDVRIIGGGPAGTASAVHLARAGVKVVLFEKTRFPRAKLCGGFISPEALPHLEALGVGEALRKSGGCPITRAILYSTGDRRLETPLPQAGYSLSRERLDTLLMARAREAGVEVQEGVDGHTQPDAADWTVIATGRRPAETEPRTAPPPAYGVQAFFDSAADLTDQVELNLLPGGYVGLVRQDDGRVNLCALLRPRHLRSLGPDLDKVLQGLGILHPALRCQMSGAHRVSPWQSVAFVPPGLRHLARERTLFVGDAACVVDPFAGEGIALSLLGARLLADAFEGKTEDIVPRYQASWQQMDPVLRWQRSLRRIMLGPRLVQEGAVETLRLFPGLLPRLFARTRMVLP